MTTSIVQGFINSIPDKRIARAFSEIFSRITPSKVDTALTAHAGGTKAAALSLKSTCSFHDVATVATAADSILLPQAKEGEFHFVKNSGAASMQVFGQGTDTIDSVATGTGVAQLAGDGVLYYCLVPGNWIRLGGVSATEVFSAITTATLNATTSVTVTSASANALAVGLAGATNPAFHVDSSTASQAAGLKVTGAVAAGTVAAAVISSGADANLSINAKGSGTLTLNNTATGNIVLGRAATGVSLAVTGALTSSSASAGIGYATGAGGAVIQITNRSTGVTVNALSGTIQTDTTSLAAGASAEFTVTNSSVAVGDVVVVSQRSGSSNVAGVAGTTHVHVVTVAAGSFIVSVDNKSSTTAETGAIIINFAMIKAVAA